MVWIVPLFLVASAFSLALGLVLPLVRFEKLYFFSETPSLIGIVTSLWSQGSPALAVVIALLSIVFPIAKLIGIADSTEINAFVVDAASAVMTGILQMRLRPH